MGSSIFRVLLATTVPSSGSVCEGSRWALAGLWALTAPRAGLARPECRGARLSLHETCSSLSVSSFLSRLAAPRGQGLAEDRKVLG